MYSEYHLEEEWLKEKLLSEVSYILYVKHWWFWLCVYINNVIQYNGWIVVYTY